MTELQENTGAFSNFRALTGDSDAMERDLLFRNMAQLFVHVSERCDDEQVTQYDEVLCMLADLVVEEARVHVAGLLSKLARAPGSVVIKLANDSINVARPLLEFSNVLSDDDLIEIINDTGEAHRVVIADRENIGERVGGAIVEMGGRESVVRLVNNKTAKLDNEVLKMLVARAENDTELTQGLQSRTDVNWEEVSREIGEAGRKVLSGLGLQEAKTTKDALGTVSAMAFNRMRNSAGFNAREWKLAWNQVKALADRRRLDKHALGRFARFGYGHHTGAALTILLSISPDVFVKWLAAQDYLAMSVAARAFGMDGEVFETVVMVLPWRDLPQQEDVKEVRARFDALSREEASEIFDLWRAHSFRQRSDEQPKVTATA